MTLKFGVDEYYSKNFVLNEDGLKSFQKLIDNAAQRFPAPAEVVYTVMTSDFRYFETNRIEDVLHDQAVQDLSIIQIIMESVFIEEPLRIEGDIMHTSKRENWNIRVIFTLRHRGTWEIQPDRINLRIVSEDRKWAEDYIDKFEDEIYKLRPGARTPVMIFWLFAIPLFFLIRDFVTTNGANAYATSEPFLTYSYYGAILASIIMVTGGISLSIFKWNPQIVRLLFGPMSGFGWGESRVEFEAFDSFRHFVLWLCGGIFLLVIFAAIKFTMN